MRNEKAARKSKKNFRERGRMNRLPSSTENAAASNNWKGNSRVLIARNARRLPPMEKIVHNLVRMRMGRRRLLPNNLFLKT